MQLTLYTDYSLRVLIYLALSGNRLVTISEIARAYGISRNHLVKVVHNLSMHGFIDSVRGKGGGVRLSRAAARINIGAVIRQTEPNFNIVECFDPAENTCPISPVCALKNVLKKANREFLKVLDNYTLADLTQQKALLRAQLPQDAMGP